MRNAIGLRACDPVRMARPRRTAQDLHTLDVEFVPDGYEPPRHYLREWREYKHLTQEQFAELLGTSKSQISDLENSNRGLGYKWLWKASQALKIRPGFILEHNPDDLPTDVLEVWGTIPETDKPKAIRALRAFQDEDRRSVGE